jgi:cytoskeleton protein RodZ
MRQKLDIADVEERTKIRAKYLRALENEEFGLLPGSTFVKTFLRTYAEVLGLDAHLLVEEYRANYEPSDELDGGGALGAPPPPQRERRALRVPRAPRPPSPPRGGTLVAAVLVAILGFLLVLGLVSGDEGDGGESGDRATETEQRTETARRRRPRRRPAPTAVALRVAPTVPTYVCLDRGPGTDVVFEGILQQPQTFRGETLRINLGKTSAALTANGKPVEIEPTPNPVGFEVTPSGAEPLEPEERPCA